jgi:hypothetical protein
VKIATANNERHGGGDRALTTLDLGNFTALVAPGDSG